MGKKCYNVRESNGGSFERRMSEGVPMILILVLQNKKNKKTVFKRNKIGQSAELKLGICYM